MPGIYQNCDFNITYKQLIKFCKAGDFPLPLIKYLQQIYILGMQEKRGLYFSSCRGAPLPNEPVSKYICTNLPKTDDNDRTQENDLNALS